MNVFEHTHLMSSLMASITLSFCSSAALSSLVVIWRGVWKGAERRGGMCEKQAAQLLGASALESTRCRPPLPWDCLA